MKVMMLMLSDMEREHLRRALQDHCLRWSDSVPAGLVRIADELAAIPRNSPQLAAGAVDKGARVGDGGLVTYAQARAMLGGISERTMTTLVGTHNITKVGRRLVAADVAKLIGGVR